MADELTIQKKYTRDIVLSTIANAAIALQGFGFLVLLSKTVGPVGYGIWTQILTTIALLMPVALLQMGFAMTRFLGTEKGKNKISTGFFSVLAAATITSSILSILLFVFAEPFSATFFKESIATSYIQLSAILILLTSLNQVIIQYFWAFRETIEYAIYTLAQVIGELVLVMCMVFSGLGLFGAIAALICIRTLLFIAGFIFVKRQIDFAMPSIAVLKYYLALCLPLFPSTLSLWVIQWGNRYVIGYFLDVGQVGLFAAAYSIGNIIYFLYTPLIAVLFPTLTYLYDNGRLKEVRTFCSNTLKFFLSLAIPAAFGLLILSKQLLGIMTTPQFAEAHLIIPLIAFGTLFQSVSDIFGVILLLTKETRLISRISVSIALTSIVLSVVFVPLLGIIGAAISTLVVFIASAMTFYILAHQRIQIDIDVKFLLKCLAASIIMSAIVYVINPSDIVTVSISIVAGAIAYVICLLLLKGLNKDNLESIRAIIRK